MKRFTAIVLFISAAAINVSAQRKTATLPRTTEWDEHPLVHDVPPNHAHEPALILQQDVTLDYRHEGHIINVYRTVHRLVKVLDEKGIEQYNKIEIPVGWHTRVPLIKARTIQPTGKVKDIAQDMIKVTKNEYGQNEVVIAMEGVEKNSEIELMLNEITPLAFFGTEYFQSVTPVMVTRFNMSYPNYLMFEEKGYNGFPTVRDTLLNNRRHISITKYDIPALKKESQSYYDLHRMRAEYRIEYFMDDQDKKRLYTWHDMAKDLYDDYYNLPDKDIKAANKYLTELGVPGGGNELWNIKKIEDGIKKNIVLYDDVEGDHENDLDSVISKKAATQFGYIRLFIACFTQAGVKFELGRVGSRYQHRFDSKFENWGNMGQYVFYFPKEKKFLSPASIYYRYPMVPVSVLTNKGVFCKLPPKTLEVINGGMEEMLTIDPSNICDNRRGMTANVTFSNDMEANVDLTYSYWGYTAAAMREALAVQTKDKQNDLLETLVPLADKPEHVVKYATANEGFNCYHDNKPFEVTATITAPQLVEQADKKYLFRIGDIIGSQRELYSEKERKLPVDIDYPNSYSRTITVNIPKGYKVLNADDMNISADYVDKTMKPVVSFNSSYTLVPDKKNGDKLVVTVTESYSQLHFEPIEYERYRKVVNAAADFNKVTLLMSKKG